PARGVVAGVCKAPLPGDACHVRRRAAEPRLFWPEVSFAVAGHDPDDRAPRVAVLLDRQGRLLAYVGSTDLQGLFARAARRRADWAGLCAASCDNRCELARLPSAEANGAVAAIPHRARAVLRERDGIGGLDDGDGGRRESQRCTAPRTRHRQRDWPAGESGLAAFRRWSDTLAGLTSKW